MDWDRTVGRLRELGERFFAFGMLVDNAQNGISSLNGPEGRTVEGLGAHADKLRPYIDMFDPEGIEELIIQFESQL